MKTYWVVVILCVLTAFDLKAQDLNARVQIVAPLVQNANKTTLNALENTVRDFLNGKRWSTTAIGPEERIECSFVINILEWDGSSNFRAEAQIQSSRPVFGSSYNSTVLNISDRDFNFTYIPGQALDFSDQRYIDNLTSLLAYYAYIIVGMDYDTFGRLEGTAYYTKAQAVVNNAQNSSSPGWKAFEGLRNRYWLTENFTSNTYEPVREFLYRYHYSGLDVMFDNPDKGKNTILALLPSLLNVDKRQQGSMLTQILFTAKADEIVNIFQPAPIQERLQAYKILSSLDPPNIHKYELLKTNQ